MSVKIKTFFREVLRSGTIAGFVMIPFGLTFSVLGLRINHYGQKIIQLLFSDLSKGFRFGLFVFEHFIISWVAAIPLLLLLLILNRRIPHILIGLIYGIGFYIIINSLLLPIAFGDPLPWQLGFIKAMFPSLVVHISYSLSIAFTSRYFVNQNTLSVTV